jgi:hypothetical protein
VLRAKYFPNGNLLDTVTAGEASQTWRAIEYGLDTTGKPTFAVRQNLCHAFYIGRTAKKIFAVSFLYGTRQSKNAW